ncbi:MAG TPA: NAD(P)-dependent oxidoreductase [Edaphocola sp.]|nr:NAD(P)-dependent oxidoreductase [Edaphocola sp.]
MVNSRKALVFAKIDPVLTDFLEEKGYELVFYNNAKDKDFLLQNGKQFEGIVLGTNPKMDRALIDACPQLKWIARVGSGMDHIDVEYARNKNIFCCSSPEGNANAVAEQALGVLLALFNNIYKSFEQLKNSVWDREGNRGFEIEGKTAGIVGLGNNGYRFAQKLSALGVNVLAFDLEKKEIQHPGIIQVARIEELFHSDILSFHVPYTDLTHHYFDKPFLDSMHKPFVLLNLCRGKVVNQEVLLHGLQQGKISAAAIDVWEVEPIHNMPDGMRTTAMELLAMPNFIGTSHIGGYSFEAITKMSLSLKNKLAEIIL